MQHLTELPPFPPLERTSDGEFRDQIIYFVVLDRFHSGVDDNLGQRVELNDPTRSDWHKYWGGDLQGLYDRLDYLQELGVTAIWVTPLFEQVEEEVLEGEVARAAIHGYWTQDFKRINSRWVNDSSEVRVFARNDTILDRLLAEMHRRGMKFILDFVCNHSSPPTRVGKGKLYDDGVLIADFDDDSACWYHHYGPVQDWTDAWQIQNCEVAGLATFNENNVHYRRYIKEAAKAWLDKGVDALRIDTVKHMPIWFWQEFDADLRLHKPKLFIFGEWIDSSPQDPAAVECANTGGMSLIDFGFCHAVRNALARRLPAGFALVEGLLSQDSLYRNATELVTCIESHDMPRFQSLDADHRRFHLALILLLTSRGIPTLLYGCEQYLHNDTNGGEDPYNRPMMESWEDTEATRLIAILSRERRANEAMKLGGQWTRYISADIYAFERVYRDSRCLVVLNQGAATSVEFGNVALPAGRYHSVLDDREIDIADGRFQAELGEMDAVVLGVKGKKVEAAAVIRFQVNGAPSEPGDQVVISGSCPELGEWDLSRAFVLECINSTTWFGEVAFEHTLGETIAYKYAILRGGFDEAPIREPRVGRFRLVMRSGTTKWRDIWGC